MIEFSGPDDSITDPSRSKNVVIQYTAYDDFKGRGKTEVVNSPLGFLGAEVVQRADAMVQKGPNLEATTLGKITASILPLGAGAVKGIVASVQQALPEF